jgi:UDP-N-acetylmuramoyl-tripeptide--D-alanyl-D-alanine ligase
VVKFGIDLPADFRGENIVIHKDGCASFTVEGCLVRMQVPGYHMVYNALAAWSVGRLMGMEGKDISEALENFSSPHMRMQMTTGEGIRFINDAYNANPLSMRAAVEVLRSLLRSGDKKITAVLGDMLELGSITEESHREIGILFGELGIEFLCLVGKYANYYREGAIAAGMSPEKIRMFSTTVEAIPYIEERKIPGSTIFIKGSRALGLERIITDSDRKA